MCIINNINVKCVIIIMKIICNNNINNDNDININVILIILIILM